MLFLLRAGHSQTSNIRHPVASHILYKVSVQTQSLIDGVQKSDSWCHILNRNLTPTCPLHVKRFQILEALLFSSFPIINIRCTFCCSILLCSAMMSTWVVWSHILRCHFEMIVGFFLITITSSSSSATLLMANCTHMLKTVHTKIYHTQTKC